MPARLRPSTSRPRSADRAPTVFDGAQVGDVRPESLPAVIRDVDVFARVSPADKYRIVRALPGRR
jgi:magnesium-transporting ATPase (P-type)